MNQPFVFSITLFIFFLILRDLGFAIIMLVSSTNRTSLNRSAIIFRRSFILSKKNTQPRTEP